MNIHVSHSSGEKTSTHHLQYDASCCQWGHPDTVSYVG